MKFSWSSESYGRATEALLRCSEATGHFLQMRFASGSLAASPIELCYVPIVMPVDMHDKYKERSRIRIKQKLYECAPHLSYDVFINGTADNQLKEYVGGLSESVLHLQRLGLSDEQVSEVEIAFSVAASG